MIDGSYIDEPISRIALHVIWIYSSNCLSDRNEKNNKYFDLLYSHEYQMVKDIEPLKTNLLVNLFVQL